jgi:hypothetical protein
VLLVLLVSSFLFVHMSSNTGTPTVESSGVGRLFWITGKSGELRCEVITSRISPKQVCGTEAYQDASVFYIQCRNVHRVPSQLKGVLCAALLPIDRTKKPIQYKWCFCIIWKYVADQDLLQLYVWKGNTVPAPRGQSGCVPSYFVSNNKGPPRTFFDDFQPCQVQSLTTKHCFLNQIHGLRPGMNCGAPMMRRNKDGCFQCSPHGPDVFVLPTDSRGNVWVCPHSIPKNFYTKAQSRLFQSGISINRKNDSVEDDFAFELHTREYLPDVPLKVPSKDPNKPKKCKNRTKQEKQYSTWMFKPKVPTYESNDSEVHSVLVEMSTERLKVDPGVHVDRVAMPVITMVEK